jgi:hypothetical protein
MKSNFYPLISLKAIIYFICGLVFLGLGGLCLGFISVIIGKIIAALSMFGFTVMFFATSISSIIARKKILSNFYDEVDCSRGGINRKIILLADSSVGKNNYTFVKSVATLKDRMKKLWLLEHLEDWLSYEIGKTVGFGCYEPYVFVMIRKNGCVLNKEKEVVCGFQDGNWLEISYDENQSLSPIFLHEMAHLILSRSGFNGQHHPVIQNALEKDYEK